MPTIEANLQMWNSHYHWKDGGEEWSSAWGGSEAEWWGTILPRIHAFIPTVTILEIAPGYGRWTQYLIELCDNLLVVDLSQRCIEACRERFKHKSGITCFVNDGTSLDMIADQSIDFVFSLDSLVHADSTVIEAYLSHIAKKLKPNGVGFIHHSNLGAHLTYLSLIEQMPTDLREFLLKKNIIEDHGIHWRDASVSAELFEKHCKKVDLQCISQELINWGGRILTNDCFSIFTRRGSDWDRPNIVLENKKFMEEVELIKRIAPLYFSTESS